MMRTSTGNDFLITVNGEPRSILPGTTVAQLVAQCNLQPIRVAVERNEELVPRAQFDRTVLREGDRIEIVTFVGGG